MKTNGFKEKALFVVIVIVLAVAGELAFTQQQPTNNGIGLPNNGPCTPLPKMAGVCSDNGVPSLYGADGIVVHLPAKGDQGDPGKDGADGKDGAPGPAGPPGAPGKDAVFPQKIMLVCLAGTGTVAKGFTAKDCTVTVSQ